MAGSWGVDRHLQEAWLSFMSLASCSVFSSAGAEPSQICLNSGTRSFSLYTCSARCRSRKPTAMPHSAPGPVSLDAVNSYGSYTTILRRLSFRYLKQDTIRVRHCKRGWDDG